MKTRSISPTTPGLPCRTLWMLPALAVLLAPCLPAGAASATWQFTPTDSNWETSGSENNWSTGVATYPGGTSTGSADTATFTNSSVKTITINGSDWNIKGIVFSNANCAAFTFNNTISGEESRFTGGGGITISNEVTQPQIFTGDEWRMHTGGGLTLINNSATPAATLTFNGGIKANNGADANATDQALNLQGSNPGANTVGGAITDYSSPPVSGEFAAVTKSGTGAWYLTGNSTYSGPTIVTGGLLGLKGSGAVNASTNIVVNGSGATLQINNPMNLTAANNCLFVTNSGTLQVTNAIGQTTVTVASLVVSNATLRLGVNGSTPYTDITVTSALNAGSGITLDIDQISQLTAATTFDLISYAGADPLAADFTVALGAGFTGYSVGSVVVGGGLVTVTITPPSSASLVWVGAASGVLSGKWDLITKDWVDQATLSIPQAYANPDVVQFNDNASTNVVTLTGNVAPFGIGVVNNTLNYTFNGSGLISGPAGLIKQGSASLTLADTGGDVFSGGITNDAGTLILDDANSVLGGPLTVEPGATVQIGSNDGNGSLPTGSVDDEGTLIFSRTNNVVVSTAIAGGGSLVQNGSGTLTLNNANTFAGSTYVSRGTLALTGAGSLADNYSMVVSNATLDISGLAGQTVLINAMAVTNAAITIGFSANGLPVPLSLPSGLYADGIVSVSNVLNFTSLPSVASYPATITVIQASGLYLANGNFNFILGQLPAASPAYAGSIVESPDQTSVQLLLTSGPVGSRPVVTWVGVDNTSTTTNWSDRLNWQLPGAPASTDNVIFNNTGVVSAGTVNNVVDQNFTVASLTYTNVGSGNYQVTDIPAGNTLTVTNFTLGGLNADGAISDVAFTDAGTLAVDGSPLNIGNLGVSTADSGSLLDLSGLSNFVYTAASGTINLGAGNRSTANLNLAGVSNSITVAAWNANALSTSSSSSGTLTLGAGTNILNVGTFTIASQRSSCTVKFPSGSAGGLRLRGTAGTDTNRTTMTLGNRQAGGSGGTTTATLAFNGNPVDIKLGTLIVGEVSGAAANIGTGSIAFDTGTVDATTVNMAVAGLAGATANGSITVGANGTLVIGSGGLSLVNATAGTANGSLTDNGGIIIASNSIVKSTAAGTASISLNGGTLAVLSGTIGTPAAPIDNLTLGGGTLQLNITPGVTAVVATTVTAGGPTVINIGSFSGVVSSSPIPLISYGSGGGDPYTSLSLGTLPTGFTGGTLVDDTANSSIDLVVTPPATLVWAGAVGSALTSSWDLSTLDWKNAGTPAAYADPDYVRFDDTASTNTVTLTTTVSPGTTVFANNTLNYTVNGTGGLSGTGGLTKQGTGTLTLDNSGANGVSGGFTISAGTVQIGKNDANGSLPAGGVTDNGSLVFDQTANATVANVLSGAGSFVQIGNSTVTLSANNTNLTGGILVTNGILTVTASTALGALSGLTTITNNGSFDDNALAFNATATPRLVVSGAGYNNGGAIINSGAAQESAFSNVTMSASVTLGGIGRWDVRAGTGTAASLNESPAGSSYTITKVGTNEIALVNVGTIDSALGDIYVQQGEFALQVGTVSPGNPSANLIVSPGALLEVYELGSPLNKVITFNGDGVNNSFSADVGASNQNVVIGPVTLNGNVRLSSQSGVFATFGGVIGGSGSLIKVNGGVLTLTNVETYTGTTTISSGTLALAGLGALSGSPAITLTAGSVLSVSGRSDATLTLNSGQTVGGSGAVSGNLTSPIGSTVAPVGVLTVATNVTLAGSSVLELNGATNDVLAAGAALNYGGTLTLTNISGTPLVLGSSFKLFSAGSYTGTFSSIVTEPPLAGGLAWTNNGSGVFSVISAGAIVSQVAITGFNLSGGNVVINGTNTGAGTIYVLSTTNLTQPLGQWLPVATNSVSGSFLLTITNAANPAVPQSYYILSTTNN